MSGKEILIGVTILALAWGSTTVIHDYLQTQRDIQIAHITSDEKKALLQSYQFMSAEETKRMEIFAKAMSENELAQGALDDSSHLHKEMLKSATKAQNSEINGVKLDQAIASELVKAPQESPQPQQINGTFEVLNLSWEKPNTITLRKIDDGRIVKARFDLPLLSQESKDVIKNTEWKENGKRHLEAKINARVVKGRVVTADLVSAEIKK